MPRVEVVLVPVALVPAEPDQLRLMAFRPSGTFLRDGVKAGEDVPAAVLRLAERVPSTMGPPTAAPESVAFLADGADVALVFSVPLPLAGAPAGNGGDPERIAADWVLVTPWIGRGNVSRSVGMSVEHELVRNYWRRQFEETSAALEFLPRYFTIAQVRAAYSSLWAEEQHIGAFYRWFGGDVLPDGRELIKDATDDVVRDEVQRVFTAELQASELGPQLARGTTGASALGSAGKSVGMSAAILGATGLGILPAAALAAGVAGAVVAFQRRPNRGKKPTWYRRRSTERVLLDDPYAPRPRWPPTGAAPSISH